MEKTRNLDKIQNPYIFWGIIITAVLIGTIIRFKGLGTWPLALDEYYIIKSTEFILEHGLPQFPNGGYYIRGVLIQYLIAPLLELGISPEFAGRFYTVIANLITIPALYLIAKRVGNQLIAGLVIIIFSFSIWEIEFARFARMYTPFQAIFIWYIYFALKDFENKSFNNYWKLVLLSAISFLVYEGSIFLAVFNFIPFILNRKIKIVYLIAAIITFLSSAFVNLYDFRTLNSNPIFPDEFKEIIVSNLSASPIRIPQILFPFAFEGIISSLLTVVLVLINIFFTYKIFRSVERVNFWFIISTIFLVLLLILNQFGLFILLFLLLTFWNILEFTKNSKKILLYLSSIFLINVIFWFGYGLLTKNWYVLFDDFSSYSVLGVSKRLIIGFFNYPDSYYTFYNYFKTLPFLTGISALLGVFAILYLLKEIHKYKNLQFIFGALIFVLLLATIPTLLYQETRYTFFAAPLLIIIVNFSVFILINILIKQKSQYANLFYIIIVLGIFVISKDFNIYHLLNIDSQEVNYRMIYNNNMKKHLYRRWDIKTPVEYVKENMNPSDKIMINEDTPEYYLPKVDYYSFDYKHKAFVALSVENGTKERWTNSNLIYNNEDLVNLLESNNTTIWFLVFPELYLKEIDFYNKYEKNLVYEGVDKMIKVFKFPNKID